MGIDNADYSTSGTGVTVNLSTGDGNDIVYLDISGATDTVTDFNMTLVGGKTIDQLDVSELTNALGASLTWRDVVVTDTIGDGTGDAILSFPGGERVVLQNVRPDQVDGWRELTAIGIPCFAAGTPILTPSGARPVETFKKGDLVVTPEGPAPVIWAGSRTLGRAELEADPGQLPIHFEPASIGNTLTLRLSPQHAVLVTGVGGKPALVRAKHLAEAGLRGVRIARGVRSATYHHLLLEQHSLVQAAGAMVETMYPGRVALAAFHPAARIAIAAAIYSVRKSADAGIVDLRDLSQIYGPRCLPLLGRKDAMRTCGNLTPPKPCAGPRLSGGQLA